jgi:hypothetical protein
MKYDRTLVRHWEYMDGWRDAYQYINGRAMVTTKEFDETLVGWHCWVYPADDDLFVQWMENNMKGEYECDHRFNSGDPMYTVKIKDDEDATLFKLTWM